MGRPIPSTKTTSPNHLGGPFGWMQKNFHSGWMREMQDSLVGGRYGAHTPHEKQPAGRALAVGTFHSCCRAEFRAARPAPTTEASRELDATGPCCVYRGCRQNFCVDSPRSLWRVS